MTEARAGTGSSEDHLRRAHLMRTTSIFLIAIFFLSLWGKPPVFAAGVFPAGSQAADIDQWANGPTIGSSGSWQNGNIGTSNSHYREDYVVPYRAVLTGLVVGHSYTIPIEWATTKGGL